MAYFHRTVFLGHDLSLFLPDPNWDSAVEIAYRLSAHVQQGRTGRENRWPKHWALRHDLSASWVLEKDDTAALQAALYDLQFTTTAAKRVFVGLPLFMDRLEPVRWGERIHDAAWVINYDATGFAIHAADELPGSPAYEWFAPLIVGRLDKRPQLKALTDWDSGFSLKLIERSPWDFRIAPAPEGVTPTDWPELLIDWSERPFDWTEDTLSYSDVGDGRVEALDGQMGVMRRGQEITVALDDRAQIRALLNFYLARKGRVQSFAAPWQLRPGVDSVATPHTPRARFADDALVLRYLNDAQANCRTKMVTVPWEEDDVAGEAPEQDAPAYFYRFWIDVPGGPIEWRFTNWESDLVRVGDGTYLGDVNAFFQHDEITHTIDLQDNSVTLTSYVFAGNPLNLIRKRQLDVPMHIDIRRGTPANPAAARIVYRGEIGEVKGSPDLTAETLVLGGRLQVKVPAYYYGPDCQHQFCGAGCNRVDAEHPGGSMPPENWTFTATISAVAANVVTLEITDNPPGVDLVDDYLAGAWIKSGEGEAFELKKVVRSEKLGATTQRLTLKRALRLAGVGSEVIFMPACSGTRAECTRYGNRKNYGAHPHIGPDNLSLPTQETPTQTVTKK